MLSVLRTTDALRARTRQKLGSTRAATRSTRQPTKSRGLHVAIVGSGPAGFYTADELFRSGLRDVKIDMYEKLPTPYGLVRSGVAPDHPEVKIVENVFKTVASSPSFNFVGNVTIGKDLSIDELKANYQVIVLAYGAESDKKLGIPGESLKGVHSARSFVEFYNALPDGPERNAFDLSATDIAIIGNGNVAVDVARILLRKPEQLEKTDISESAMESLKLTTIRRVSLIGRRGPVQAAYTTGELRELLGLEGVVKRVPDVGLVLTGADEEELKQRALARKFDLLKKILTSPLPKPDQSVLQFYFLRSPVEFIEDPKRPGHVGSIKFQHNMLVGPAHSQSARGTEYHSEMPAQLVFTSIGYSSKPMPGLPFDDKRGIIPNDKGKVEDGVYVCGWIKRGPTGIIGTNKFDAQEVIATIVADQQALSTVQTTQTTLSGIPLSQDFSPLSQIEQLLSKRNVDPVRFSDWEILDKEELTRGEARSKLREKFKKSKEMLQFLEDRSTL